MTTHPPPSWLKTLHGLLLQSSFFDLRVVNFREAYLYGTHRFVPVDLSIMADLFDDTHAFEQSLTKLAWQYKWRFDPYHPYVCHDIVGIGRITLIKDVLGGGGCELFLRYHDHQIDYEYDDPHHLREIFCQNFCQYPWLICGASGAGKTSLLFSELACQFSDKTVVVMDRFQERPIRCPMWVFLKEQSEQVNHKGRVDATHLLDIAFKLGASTLVFGELRTRDMPCFFHGMHSGHSHIYGTFHASSPSSLCQRMEMIMPGSAAVIQKTVASLYVEKVQDRFVLKDLYLPQVSRISQTNP